MTFYQSYYKTEIRIDINFATTFSMLFINTSDQKLAKDKGFIQLNTEHLIPEAYHALL